MVRLSAVAVFFALSLAACSDRLTNPAPNISPEQSPSASRASDSRYSRLLSQEQQQESRRLSEALKPQKVIRSSAPVPGSVSTSAVADGNICGIEVHPVNFTLDVTGGAYPRGGYLSLWIWSCDGTATGYWDNHFAYWSSSDPSVISVNSSGYVYGNAAGAAMIGAYVSGYSNSARGVVLGAPVITRVAVTPSSANVTSGNTVQLSAQAYDQYGYALSGVTYGWSSSNGGIATVNSAGLVTGISFGTATISACADGKCGTSTINVDPLSVSVQGPCVTCVVRTDFTVRTFTARPVGGTGSYTYVWRVYRPYGASYEIGYDQSVSVNFTCGDNGDNDVEVTVSSGGQSVTASKGQYVEIPPESCTY